MFFFGEEGSNRYTPETKGQVLHMF